MAMCLLNAAHEAMTTTITPGKLTGGKNTKPCEYYRLVYVYIGLFHVICNDPQIPL